MAFLPLLFFVFVLTVLNLEWGFLSFVFLFPLVNNLPYFFGIHENVPHAPAALVLFLVYFLGWILQRSLFYSHLDMPRSLSRPMILIFLVISLSAIITYLRYMNFFPFLSGGAYELIVNENTVRAGGALMSVTFNFLSYLTGFLLFIIVMNSIPSRPMITKIMIALSASTFISLAFSLLQKYHSIGLGNTPSWVYLNQINSTFKDPNSFGAHLSALLPIFLGMICFFRRQEKLFPLFLALFSLFVLPSVGSRSSFLAIVVSVFAFTIFLLRQVQKRPEKKYLYAIALFAIALILLFSLALLSRKANLPIRLSASLTAFLKTHDLPALITGRSALWESGWQMIKDFPVTGVGLGGYIVELPNYLRILGLPFPSTDSAENYFLQIGSELGLIGLLLTLWLFWKIFQKARVTWKFHKGENKDGFLLIGLFSGIIALLTNFFFHSYVGSFETQYLFWLFVGLTIAWPASRDIGPKTSFGAPYKLCILIVAIIFASLHLWNSKHSLSINSQTEKFGWSQDFGLYDLERDDRGLLFQWTKQTAGLAIENLGPTLVIPMLASHPDIQRNPVRVKVYSANPYFRKKALIREITFQESTWTDFEWPILNSGEKRIYLVFETNRSWQPAKLLGVPDPRHLAIGLGERWYKYPTELPSENLDPAAKSVYNRWEGEFKENLIGNGISLIKFLVSREGAVLRLWARGQNAFGIGPYLIIRLDDKIIAKTMLTQEQWEPLVLSPQMKPGEHVLSVEFKNDLYGAESGQDRNAFLGDLEVIPRTASGEDPKEKREKPIS